MKKCIECGAAKPLDNFGINKKSADGKKDICRICWNIGNTKVKPHQDLTGKTFDKLTVLKDLGPRIINGRARRYWLCSCNCGNEREVYGGALYGNRIRHCGNCHNQLEAQSSVNWLGHEEISGTHWNAIKRRAIRKKMEFNISIEYAWNLFLKQNRKCALTGFDLRFSKNSKDRGTASLDRINSSRGYIAGNVQWTHKEINIMKSNHAQEHFVKLCKAVVDHCPYI